MVEKSVSAGGGAPVEPDFTQASAPRDAGLGDLVGAVWCRKVWVFLPLVLVTAATYVYVSTTPERYTSLARLLIEDRQTVFTKPQGELQTATLFDKEAVASQVQIITAREVAQAVSDRLALTSRAEFDPATHPPSLVKRILVALGLSPDKERMAPIERVIETYYDRLSVYPIEGSRVIAISFSAQDPQLAADAANAIADHYMALQQQAKQQTTSDATTWLGGQIEELRGKVEAAEGRVESFKTANGLQRGEAQAPLNQQQMSEINRELVVAKTARAEAAARADTIRRLLDENGDLASAADVVSSPHIERLVEQQVILRRRIAELSPTLLPAHPRMRELKMELQELRAQINEEAKKVAIALDNEALIATARERAVTESLDAIKADSQKAATAEVELRALEREAKAQRDLLESFLIRYREAAARQDAQALPAEARIISRATPANRPSFPLKGPMLAIAMAATLIISISLIIAGELMRFARRTPPTSPAVNLPPREVNLPQKTRPTTAKVRPIPPAATPEPSGVVRLDVHHFPDAIRTLGEMVSVAQPEGVKCTKVLLSTPQRQQRNNYLAVNLARLLSASGKRVLLVDANVRAPRLADHTGLDEAPGLYELLSGACAFSEAIKRDPRSRLHVICAGSGKKDLAKIFSPDRVAKLIEALDGSYEFVLLDAPPVALSPETKGLAAFVDMAVLLADTLPGSAKLMDKAVDILNASAKHGLNVVEAEPITAEMVRLPGEETRRQVA